MADSGAGGARKFSPIPLGLYFCFEGFIEVRFIGEACLQDKWLNLRYFLWS